MQNRVKKIAFVLPALTAGGAERVLITLMNGIDRSKFEPVFITVSDRGDLRNLIEPTIPFYSLGRRRVLFSIPSLYLKLREIGPDIAVSTMAHMNFSMLMIRPFLPRTKFIVREAITPSFIIDSHPLLSLPLSVAYKILYPTAHRVISPAQAIIDEFGSLLKMKRNNHVLLHNPVSVKQVRAEENRPLPDRPGNIVHFIAAGRLHKQKGFDRLINILPQFKGDWQLTILGEGQERAALEALIAQKGLQDKISLPGHITNPWPRYAAADCFLMPSRHEGLPNVILESLTCGTSAIATKESGGVAEIVQNAAPGTVIVARDMAEFLRAMEKVTPSPAKTFRPSLLPECYKPEAVLKSFEEILSG
jgi:glycosyltransferase involved in cell wall biosynthesis